MSDRPLFQNTDEQEQAYAPQELAEGDPEARGPAGETGDRAPNLAGATIIPAAGAGVLSGAGGGGLGAAGGAGGVPGGAAIGAADVTEGDDTSDRSRSEG